MDPFSWQRSNLLFLIILYSWNEFFGIIKPLSNNRYIRKKLQKLEF